MHIMTIKLVYIQAVGYQDVLDNILPIEFQKAVLFSVRMELSQLTQQNTVKQLVLDRNSQMRLQDPAEQVAHRISLL